MIKIARVAIATVLIVGGETLALIGDKIDFRWWDEA